MATYRELKEQTLNEAKDVGPIIKALISTSFGGSNDEQAKAVELLKGLAFSDDPKSDKFMKALDKFTSAMDPEDFA